MYKVIPLALSYVCTCMCLRDHTCGDVLTVPILVLASLDRVVDFFWGVDGEVPIVMPPKLVAIG